MAKAVALVPVKGPVPILIFWNVMMAACTQAIQWIWPIGWLRTMQARPANVPEAACQ